MDGCQVLGSAIEVDGLALHRDVLGHGGGRVLLEMLREEGGGCS